MAREELRFVAVRFLPNGILGALAVASVLILAPGAEGGILAGLQTEEGERR